MDQIKNPCKKNNNGFDDMMSIREIFLKVYAEKEDIDVVYAWCMEKWRRLNSEQCAWLD